MQFHDVTVGSYIQIVEAVSGFLRKGAEHCAAQGTDVDTLVDARLAPDMNNLHFQVVCVTHHSLGALEGMRSGEFRPPNYPQTDYAGLQSMTDDTLAALRALTPDEVNGLMGKRMVFRLGDNEIPFTAENFALSFSLPNFYFHATTAYDLLRAAGVELGKRDFLGALKMG